MQWNGLIHAAREAREHSYAPYSGFHVGAAIVDEAGRVFAGSNVENRSFGSTLCAERVAVATAISSGSKGIRAVVVLTEADPPAAPCGLCLQVLTEFAGPELPILVTTPQGTRREYRLRDLHPHPFEMPAQGLGRLSR